MDANFFHWLMAFMGAGGLTVLWSIFRTIARGVKTAIRIVQMVEDHEARIRQLEGRPVPVPAWGPRQ